MRFRSALVVSALVLSVAFVIWRFRSAKRDHASQSAGATSSGATTAPALSQSKDSAPTAVYAHNLMLRTGPSFRVYVRWLRGKLTPARRNVNPSFDDPDSFAIDIGTGVLRANIGDIANYLNAGGLGDSPLKNVTLWGDGSQVNIKGTLHKIIPLSIQVTGEMAALSDNRIRIHVTKISLLKVPLKRVLGSFHITISDLFHPKDIRGIQISGNDMFLDPQALLPPPHIRGHLTAVRVVNPDLEEIYGSVETEVARVEQWRNFLRLAGGTLDFGKLTMHHVDLILIDISNDAWFDLDLSHYQKQLVYGYSRMTPQAGLQIFMPDLSTIPQNNVTQNLGIEWMKNRDKPPPQEVMRH